jgi:hypothetical protein
LIFIGVGVHGCYVRPFLLLERSEIAQGFYVWIPSYFAIKMPSFSGMPD